MPSSVVVIGAGLGGLAIAIRLQARGYQVTLVERGDAPGGRAHVIRDQGFVLDSGPTLITAPWLIEELFELAGKKADDYLRMVPLDPCYRIRFADGRVFDYRGTHEGMVGEIQRFAPSEVAGYERFLAMSERICQRGFVELGDIPFSSFGSMMKVAPALIRLSAHRSVYSLVSRYFRDEAMRQVMSFHPLFIGGNPFAASSIYAMVHFIEQKWGVHFAMGGMSSVIDGLARLFTEIGGELRLGTTVEEILVDGRKARGVRLAGGGTIAADVVVSDADAAHTYLRLLGKLPRRRWTDGKLARARYSMGLFVLAFGSRKRFDDVAHHSILLGPRYRELLHDIFNRKVLADDFSLYLHRPTATDRSLAPEGGDACYVLSPVPHLDGGIDWSTAAEPYARKLVEFLDATVMPGLRESIAVQHVITPQTFADRLLSEKGAGFSLEPVLTQSAWFRPHNRSEEVDGLFLVGAGTHPGGGIPGTISGARVVDRLLPRLAGDPGRDPIAGTHA